MNKEKVLNSLASAVVGVLTFNFIKNLVKECKKKESEIIEYEEKDCK